MDPHFPPDSSSLFLNGKHHRDSEIFTKKKKWESYEWVRLSDYFKGCEYCMFNIIEPEDVKKGNVDNCAFMATVSGMAMRDLGAETGKNKKKGRAIRDIFITQDINKAGCYVV